jgi:hypothetical protein
MICRPHIRRTEAHFGTAARGREQLTYIPGDVALPPFPRWVMTETALSSVGSLLRRLHDASAAITVDTRAAWPQALADPEGGTMLCHLSRATLVTWLGRSGWPRRVG